MLRSMWKKIRRLAVDKRPISTIVAPPGDEAHSPAIRAGLVVDTDGNEGKSRQRRPGKNVAGHGSARPAPRVSSPKKRDSVVLHASPPREGMARFNDFELVPGITRAIDDLGFEYCTPIQAAAIPFALAGRDIAGRAQTGTGKTAAFLIAIFNRFYSYPRRHKADGDIACPRALVIAPTRELAMQIESDALALGKYLDMRTLALFGGSDMERQRRKLQQLNPELIVATPGRLLDFRSRRNIDLRHVEILVIDEADRMLDMGFIPDVRRIVNSTPRREHRQTMLFSATLSDAVMRLASGWLADPEHIDIEPEQVAVDSVRQEFYLVTAREKFSLLYNILAHDRPERVLMFVNRRDTAEWLTNELKRFHFDCDLISGALPQNQRVRTLAAFREGKLPILVATDVAGRGLHIDAVSHVINYNIPEDAEDYVHRIGRTGRAGASGVSITFACEEESFGIPAIEKFIGRGLPCLHPRPEWLKLPKDVKPLPRSKATLPKTGERQGDFRGGRSRPRTGRRPSRGSGRRR